MSIRHSTLPGWTVARRHVTDAGAVTLNNVIPKVEEIGGSIACHPHEFGYERRWRQHFSEPPGVRVHEGREAVGEPIVRWLRCGQRGPSG